MLFDSHCHLSDERLIGEVDDVVARARAVGVSRLLTVGADPDDFDTVTVLARRLDGVWAAVGVHPHIADRTTPAVLERIEALAATPEVVAIGETGLDYHYDNAPREVQRSSFLAHLELAERLDLPVIVHTRSADDDTAAVLREAAAGRVRGVLHCFDGGPALLEAALEAGWFVSFSGMVTFKNYVGADLLRAVPADRLLVETDSPYLAPVPMRGKRNEPAFVLHTAEMVAVHRGERFDEVARITTDNACTLYGIAQ